MGLNYSGFPNNSMRKVGEAKMKHNVPVQSLIDHIKTAVDVDPWAKEMVEELLKEQETVEPKAGHWIVLEYCANEGIYCSECHMKIFDRITKPKGKLSQYCPHCGSRNEQFFRDGEVVFR